MSVRKITLLSTTNVPDILYKDKYIQKQLFKAVNYDLVLINNSLL